MVERSTEYILERSADAKNIINSRAFVDAFAEIKSECVETLIQAEVNSLTAEDSNE